MTDLEILALLVKAKELGVTMDDVKAVSRETKQTYIPEMKAEDIVKPLSVLDDYSEEEIKYWATPYFDELQARKKLDKEKQNTNI